MLWMLLVLFYGVLKGVREVVKKIALRKSTVMEVLFIYTLLSFLFVLPQAPAAGGLSYPMYGLIALKSFVIFLAWICSFKAIHQMPISLYGVLDLSRVLFATLLGVTVLGETMTACRIAGILLVSAGLLLLKYKPSFLKKGTASGKENSVSVWLVLMAFASCILNAVSGMMDKILMKDITSAQLQFWYMLFLAGYYLLYILLTRTRIRLQAFKNGWIWLLSLLFVIADKALFIANGYADSQVTIMTLLKQSGAVVAILSGKLIFKEKNVGYKLFCAGIIVIGIVIGVMKP